MNRLILGLKPSSIYCSMIFVAIFLLLNTGFTGCREKGVSIGVRSLERSKNKLSVDDKDKVVSKKLLEASTSNFTNPVGYSIPDWKAYGITQSAPLQKSSSGLAGFLAQLDCCRFQHGEQLAFVFTKNNEVELCNDILGKHDQVLNQIVQREAFAIVPAVMVGGCFQLVSNAIPDLVSYHAAYLYMKKDHDYCLIPLACIGPSKEYSLCGGIVHGSQERNADYEKVDVEVFGPSMQSSSKSVVKDAMQLFKESPRIIKRKIVGYGKYFRKFRKGVKKRVRRSVKKSHENGTDCVDAGLQGVAHRQQRSSRSFKKHRQQRSRRSVKKHE